MAVRIKELRDMTLYFQDGFSGTSAVNDASIAASDTVLGVDTHALFDDRTLVPIGARFTTAGIATIRTVTATQNSVQYTLDMTTPTAGTFDLTVTTSAGSQTASAIAYNVSAAAFVTALEALSNVAVGDVAITETTDVYTITFQGNLANDSSVSITVDGSGLTAPNSHVLTAVQDGTSTWEVTFTPAIATGSLPVDDDVITWYPRRLEFEVETGDFEWTEGANPVIRKPRGVIAGLRQGEDQEMSVTSSFSFSWLRAESTVVEGGADDKTPYECLHQLGFASDWLPSSHGSPCEPYTVDIVIEDRPSCGSEQAEVYVFPQFAFEEISPTVSGGVVNFSGLCVATRPIITRVANTDDAVGVIY